jgi:cation diffusion facilitator family transporter
MSDAKADVKRDAVRRVLWLTLGLNLLVSVSKLVVGQLSGSLAMVADGYHSLLDGSNNVIGLIVTALAFAPPDRDHPYGHRKFETAAAVVLGLGLLALAVDVARGAAQALHTAQLPQIGLLNWLVMGMTLTVNVFVSRYEAREGRRLGSAYLTADAAHTGSDVVVSLGVVASFVATRAGLGWTDPVVAAAIALFIGLLAVRILGEAFNVLTDRAALPPHEVEAVARRVPGVFGCREVRTRGGAAVHVDLTVLADGELTLYAAHDLAHAVEDAIRAAYSQVVDVVVHVEPAEQAAIGASERDGGRR